MIQKPKGTYDVFGEKGKKIQYVENIIKTVMEKYNYEYFRTPIFESSELFHRGVGETTDIVTKETYDFKDRGDRDMTLRPEGTAGICRSFVENKLYGNANYPIKSWYMGPMFRYERPQSGRYREFHQFGVEVFGCDYALADAEVISIPVNIYKLLGLKGIKVNINSLGDRESRDNYREALIKHFEPYIDEFCDDCKERFRKNPLRILDCKIDHEHKAMKTAPTTIEYLNETSKNHFDDVKKYLEAMSIDYVVNPTVVRGLDYYTHTVFEVEADIESFGAQKVLCGGGRYNGLISNIGGPEVSGVGFAMGLERLFNALDAEDIKLPYEEGIDLYIIPMEKEYIPYSISITNAIRFSGFTADIDYMNRKLNANFKQAEKLNAKYVAIIGEEEVKTNILTIKNNETRQEWKVKIDDLIDFLDEEIEEEGHHHEHE